MPDAPAILTRDGMPLATRAATFQSASYNPDKRTITVSLGSGAPVQRYDWSSDSFYTEVLGMEPSQIRLERFNHGASFLEDHNSSSVKSVVGRFIPGTARILDGQLVAEVRLSKAARHADTVQDIADGILVDTSVGYRVHEWTVTRDDAGNETRVASSWEPYEGSVVPVPADPTGGIRSASTTNQTPKADPAPDAPAAADPRSAESNTQQENTMDEKQMAEIRAEGAKAEAARQNEIRTIAAKVRVADGDIAAMLANPDVTVDAARAQILDLVAERGAKDEIRSQIVVTRDEGDTEIRAIESRLEQKAGLIRDLPESARNLRGASLVDLAAKGLQRQGVNTRGMTRGEIVGMALRAPAAHTSGDFPLLLSNVANKILVAAFQNVPEYRWYERVGSRDDFSDYKARSYPNLMGFGVLPTVTEGSEYQGITGAEVAESGTLVKKGAELRITKEMVVNDDLGAFARAVSEFGASAQRTCSAMALAAITTQVCGDSKALYHADHANLVDSGGAPDVDRIAALDALLRNQTDGNGAVIGMPAKFLFAGAALRNKIEQLYSDKFYVADPTDALTVMIAPENRIYIPGHDSTKWELGNGDPSALVYGFLAEEGGPVVSKYPDFSTDSVIFHATMSFAATCTKWQAFAQDHGA